MEALPLFRALGLSSHFIRLRSFFPSYGAVFFDRLIQIADHGLSNQLSSDGS